MKKNALPPKFWLRLALFVTLPMTLFFDIVQYTLGFVIVIFLSIGGFFMVAINIFDLIKKEEKFEVVSILTTIFYFIVGCFFHGISNHYLEI